MDLLKYILRTVAYAMVNPTQLIILIALGFMFYGKNKKISVMQKLSLGESINSPLELTLSQLALGIIAGAIGSLMIGFLGVMFSRNSGIEFIFIVSIMMLFVKKRFTCFSYSGAILGLISIILNLLSNKLGIDPIININIMQLMTFVGVMHVVEGILVIFDGSRGAIPVFANIDNKIVGGFAYNRLWALPIAIFLIYGDISGAIVSSIDTPTWWPIINRQETLMILATTMISATPLYGALSYNSITFTKSKNKKPLIGGLIILGYGLILSLVSQLAVVGLFGEIFVVIFAPLAHEIMIKLQVYLEKKGKYMYVTDDTGICILEVSPYSNFYKAGIRGGDKIIEVNNKKPNSDDEILKIIRSTSKNINFKILKISGEIVDKQINIEKNKFGILFVPKSVKEDKKVNVEEDNFKKILEEMKRKQ